MFHSWDGFWLFFCKLYTPLNTGPFYTRGATISCCFFNSENIKKNTYKSNLLTLMVKEFSQLILSKLRIGQRNICKASLISADIFPKTEKKTYIHIGYMRFVINSKNMSISFKTCFKESSYIIFE